MNNKLDELDDFLNEDDDLNNFYDESDDDLNDESEEDIEVPLDEGLEKISQIKEDKIFNNRYNSGEGLPDEYQFISGIKVDDDYASKFLKDIYEYEEQLEYKLILNKIFNYIKEDLHISKMLNIENLIDSPKQIKLNKDQINYIFNKILKNFSKIIDNNEFFNPIYILEIISSVSSLEYRKIFDSLDVEIQELLIIELNKKYNFLDKKNKFK